MKIKNITSRNFEGLDETKLNQAKSSKYSLVVDSEANAIKVAKASDSLKAKIIIVEEKDRIYGVINPKQVLDNYNDRKNKNYVGLEDALIEIQDDLEEVKNDFRHEFLNSMRTRFKYCEDAGCYVEESEDCP